MKRLIAITAILIASFSLIAGGAGEATADDGSTLIGVSKLLSHAALDAVEQGMQDYLAATGLPIRYDFQNANGDISTSASIAQQFDSEDCDIVVGIGTATAQALANVFTDRPVLFAAVTDPADAGLVADNYTADPESNVCGVSDMNPVEAQISLLAEITGAKAIGNVYSSGEQNGVVLMEQAQAACDKLGLEFVPVAIANSSEVRMATQSIIDRVDAVYIATDNNVISAIASVDDVCSAAGKPMLVAEPSGIDGLNCMIAWGFNYYSIGTALGEQIEAIINGSEPGPLGTVILSDPGDFELWFNLDTAEELGFTIPQEYLDTAQVIIQDGVKTER